LERLTKARDAETHYLRERNEIEIAKTKDLADIETSKFKSMVDAIGTQTLQAIATAGPAMQVINLCSHRMSHDTRHFRLMVCVTFCASCYAGIISVTTE